MEQNIIDVLFSISSLSFIHVTALKTRLKTIWHFQRCNLCKFSSIGRTMLSSVKDIKDTIQSWTYELFWIIHILPVYSRNFYKLCILCYIIAHIKRTKKLFDKPFLSKSGIFMLTFNICYIILRRLFPFTKDPIYTLSYKQKLYSYYSATNAVHVRM